MEANNKKSKAETGTIRGMVRRYSEELEYAGSIKGDVEKGTNEAPEAQPAVYLARQ